MTTRTGTAHFETFEAAVRYYKDYGYDRSAVRQKVIDEEIHIGKPTLKPGEKLLVNDEGRYVIEEG